MIPDPPTISQSTQNDAVRENLRKFRDWLKTFKRGGVDFTKDVRAKPTTVAGYGITDAAASVHTHAAGDIASGTLAIARGGTNAGDAKAARGNLATPKITVSDTDPTDPVDGDLWVVQTTKILYHRAAGAWYTTGGIVKP